MTKWQVQEKTRRVCAAYRGVSKERREICLFLYGSGRYPPHSLRKVLSRVKAEGKKDHPGYGGWDRCSFSGEVDAESAIRMEPALSGKRTRPDELGRIWKGGREKSRHLKAFSKKAQYLRVLQGVKTYAICQSYANRCRNEQNMMLWEAAI